MMEEKSCDTCALGSSATGELCKQNGCHLTDLAKWQPRFHGESVVKQIIEGMDDGGSRVEFGTGATRESQEGKGRFDLISTEGLFRLAKWYEKGAQKYADRNWESGLPISNCLNSLMRHTVKYSAGWTDEDHLSAIVWNAMAIMEFEKTHPEMMDLPSRMEVASTHED